MLIRFRVANHRSIRDEQELSLVASSLSENRESLVHAERYGLDLLRVAAVYGANASGKSTLFNALSFMRTAVVNSQRSWKPDGGIPRTPFALDPTCANNPSEFVVDLLLDQVRYEYGFIVNSDRVLKEWLYAYPRGRRQEWFARDVTHEKEFEFSRAMTGENRTISTLTRANSLFLSAAAQNNHEMLRPIYSWFSRYSINVDDNTREYLQVLVAVSCNSESSRVRILSLLKAADLGVTGIEMGHEDLRTVVGRRFPGSSVLEEELRDAGYDLGNRANVQLRHRSGAEGEDIILPFEEESRGTQAFFALAGLVIGVLDAGGTLFLDELDRSLHPHLAIQIVRMFNDPQTNPRNAQLIFNTHDTNLLDQSILRRDQVWFTEKGDDGATRLFPLTDFRARKYENLERGYLQGRYGAVPAVGTLDLQRVVGS